MQHPLSRGQPGLTGLRYFLSTVANVLWLTFYSPTNYDLRYHGLITYRYALAETHNISGREVALCKNIWCLPAALHTAQSMGITDFQACPLYDVLGALSVHLTDMTSYGVFANGGVMFLIILLILEGVNTSHIILQPNKAGQPLPE